MTVCVYAQSEVDMSSVRALVVVGCTNNWSTDIIACFDNK